VTSIFVPDIILFLTLITTAGSGPSIIRQ
jgi:hypothetical protein